MPLKLLNTYPQLWIQPQKKPQKKESSQTKKNAWKLWLSSRRKKEQEEKSRLAREENEKKLAMAEQYELERQERESREKQKSDFQKANSKSQELYSQPEDKLETAPDPKKGEVGLLDILCDLVDDDLIQIFGKTGTCKTSIAIQAALEARKAGKSVYYLDPEKNISKKKKS